jgi:phosphatidylglycerophosphate synthase
MGRQNSTEITKSPEKFLRFEEYSCTFHDILQEIIHGKVWNIPNAILLLRLVLGCFTIQFLHTSMDSGTLLALPLIALMFLLDMLDGALARKLHQQTLFGKVFDPLIDKILIVFGILTLFNILNIPFTLTIPFFSTHIIMVVGSLFLMLTHRALPAVRSYGAISNVLAVVSGIFYWFDSVKIGKNIMILAITSGYALLLDYIHRIKWKKEEISKKIKSGSD